MNITSHAKPFFIATPKIKQDILRAIGRSEDACFFIGYFSRSEFVCINSSELGWHIWVAQRVDVTVLVRECGLDYRNWEVKIQRW